MARVVRTLILVTSIAVLLAPALGAQSPTTVWGIARDADWGDPVAGVLVLLLDESGARVARRVSRSDGSYELTVPTPGRYRLQAERIGFRTEPGTWFVISDGDELRRDIEILPKVVQIEGLEVTSFASYYQNIVTSVSECFRPPSRARRAWAVVAFEIPKDGRVKDVILDRSSGDAEFNEAAMASIRDCAGSGLFGPLPDDLPYDALPIQFSFRPRRDGQGG